MKKLILVSILACIAAGATAVTEMGGKFTVQMDDVAKAECVAQGGCYLFTRQAIEEIAATARAAGAKGCARPGLSL